LIVVATVADARLSAIPPPTSGRPAPNRPAVAARTRAGAPLGVGVRLSSPVAVDGAFDPFRGDIVPANLD
jgi:hypothetical protein